jgi:hypothetical protein
MEQIYLIDVLKRNPKIDLVCPMFNNYNPTHWSIENINDSERIYLHKQFANTRLAFDCYGRYVDLNTGFTITKDCVIYPKKGDWADYIKPFDGYLDKYVKDNQTNEMYKVKRHSTDHRNEFSLEDCIPEHNIFVFHVSSEDLDKRYTVVDKFDPTSFKPFDKILTWSNIDNQWCVGLYSHYEPNNCIHYSLGCVEVNKFIPYNVSTQHLLGTDKECEEFYKFWENDNK